MDPILIYGLIALSILCVVNIVFILLQRKLKQRLNVMQTQIEGNEFLINELKSEFQSQLVTHKSSQETLQLWQLEHQQVGQQLEHRVKVLQEKNASLEEKLENILQEVPEDKLYLRAQKMVKLGAGIDEIVKECELPYAEAEILLAMYSKK